jgi:hypothetical protein
MGTDMVWRRGMMPMAFAGHSFSQMSNTALTPLRKNYAMKIRQTRLPDFTAINPMSLSERRRYPRFPFHSQALIDADGQQLNGTLLDISIAGGLVDCAAAQLDIGSRCSLTVCHGKKRAIHVAGTVVHLSSQLSGYLIGIEFSAVDDGLEEKILEVIHLNLASPNLLSREVATLLG